MGEANEIGRPVARVAVDISLPHLDRLFDYAVPDAMAEQAVPGARVRVRFSGRLVDGFVVERVDHSDHRLAPLARVISPVPVATPATVALARAVADRYAGSLADVLRAAIPPRHARAEAAVLASETITAESTVVEAAEGLSAGTDVLPGEPDWDDYAGGAALLRRVIAGDAVRAVWDAGPAVDWPAAIAAIARRRFAARLGMLIVVPDARDVRRVDAALTSALGRGAHEVLTADAGPQRRYGAFLRLVTGRTRIAVGTRAACFAPVPPDSAMFIWDDGDDMLVEPHAPGWHAREVLALRSHLFDAPLIAGGFTRSVVAQSWIESRWAAAVSLRRVVLRQRAPRVQAVTGEGDQGPARLPSKAWALAREGLAVGPVLVQVARRGYVPGLACQGCREPVRCPTCGGPLTLAAANAAPVCGWCATGVPGWSCAHCRGTQLRARAKGAVRTAEELGRAFPDVRVITSGGDRVIDRVNADPALVIATPGAEPIPDGGYTAVVLLDAEAMAARASLSAGEETLRRWCSAAALARPASPVVVTADPQIATVAALVRWDPGWFAARDLAERTESGLPPARRSASVTGSFAALDDLRGRLPSSVWAHGPVAAGPDRGRLLLLVDRAHARQMIGVLREAMAARSARRETPGLDVRIDPVDWGSVDTHA